MNRYGSKIREIRDKNGDTLEELAKKLNTNYSTLGKYERGERKITPELLEEIADIYDIPVSYFFGEEIELPQQLKEIGGKWGTAIKTLEDRGITPEEAEALATLYKQIKKDLNGRK